MPVTDRRPTTRTPSGAGDVQAPVAIAGRTVLQLSAAPGRVRVGLVMPAIGRAVDITVHPAAACTAVADAAARSHVASQEAEAELRRTLRATAERAGAWQAEDDAPLAAALGGASYPLLGHAYGRGAGPLAEVPRWAAPALAARTAREAATTGRVAALAGALSRPPEAGHPVQLHPLAHALMAAPVLAPDRLARVLAADGPARPPELLPGNELIERAPAVLARWGEQRTERVLTDAAAHERGPELLAEAVRFARDLGAHGPRRLPSRLVELHALYRSRIATDPGPRPRPPRPARQAARGRHPTGRAAEVPARPPAPAPPRIVEPPRDPAADARRRVYAPPATPDPAPRLTGTTPLATRHQVARLHGLEVGSLQLVVPRTCGDLHRWGGLLGTCLASYDRAAAEGTSQIVGVEQDGRLRWVLELRPVNVILQFTGAGNRPVPSDVRRNVVGALVRAGVVARTHRANAPWLEGVDDG